MSARQEVKIVSDERKAELRLDQFLKLSSAVGSGGEAKFLIQNGAVSVNGQPETRRRKKLLPGDVIEVSGKRLVVPE